MKKFPKLWTIAVLLLFLSGIAFAQKPNLLNPGSLTQQAPNTYLVNFETTQGNFVIQVNRDWAPLGADRFYNLVNNGYYTDCSFFRVIPGFMVQFGINGNPEINKVWRETNIKDDPVRESNLRGYITFATSGPNSRTSQVFINYANNSRLDSMGFAPFGKVIEGMNVVDKIFSEYGEGAPRGKGPDQSMIKSMGNDYLKKEFPKLDYIKKAVIVNAKSEK